MSEILNRLTTASSKNFDAEIYKLLDDAAKEIIKLTAEKLAGTGGNKEVSTPFRIGFIDKETQKNLLEGIICYIYPDSLDAVLDGDTPVYVIGQEIKD
jgi:hypothetical protein